MHWNWVSQNVRLWFVGSNPDRVGARYQLVAACLAASQAIAHG